MVGVLEVNKLVVESHNDKIFIEKLKSILNIEDRGSLDNILKTIAKGKSEYADCLESWKKCLEEKGE